MPLKEIIVEGIKNEDNLICVKIDTVIHYYTIAEALTLVESIITQLKFRNL